MSLLGHFRPIDGIRAMSAHPPTPVKLMQRSEGRNGPKQTLAAFVRPLRSEDEPGSHGRVNDFVAQLITSEVVEPISGAMAGDQVIRIDVLQGRNDLLDVGVVERRNDMETTDNSMHLLEAGHGLRLPDRIDDAAMAAGGEND